MFVRPNGILLIENYNSSINSTMYIVTKTQRRSDVNVPFYFELYPTSDEFTAHIKKYHPTSLVKFTREISEDKLTLVIYMVWSSRKALLKYITDPFIYKTLSEPAAEYDFNNKISSVITATETKDE